MNIKYLVRDINNNCNYIKDEFGKIKLFDTFEEAWEETDNALKGFVERIDLDEYFIIQNVFTPMEEREKCEVHNLYSILNMLNEYRGKDWVDYSQRNFLEGIKKHSNYRYLGELKVYKEE